MLLDEAEHGHLGSSQTQFRLHFRFRRNIAGLFQPEWQQGGSASKLPPKLTIEYFLTSNNLVFCSSLNVFAMQLKMVGL